MAEREAYKWSSQKRKKHSSHSLSCHVGLLRWVKISLMGQGDSMGQQRREPLLSPCKEKGKETTDQKLLVAVCAKLGIWTGAQWGCMNPQAVEHSCVTAGRLRSRSCGTWQSRSACLGKQGAPGLGSSGGEEQRLQVWPASGHYGQKLWKTEIHKHEQDRPDGGNTDELI